MKENNDQVIIYDADCPLCNWYTGQFVKHGLLGKEGREAYQKIGPYTKTQIDMTRARNQIALFNKKTGSVTYGYESLVEILANRWAWIKKVATFRFFTPVFSFFYNFISYNRKVIMPSTPRGFLDCIPDLNWPMRLILLLVCALGVEYTAGIYFQIYFHSVTRFNDLFFREIYLFLSQLLFQGAIVFLLRRRDLPDYLGNLAVVSLLGGLGLIAAHFLITIMSFSDAVSAVLSSAALGAVLMWMFMEHARRVRICGFPKVLSWTWVLFRIILFFIVFKPW